MQYKPLGQTPISISTIVFGCWQAAWPGLDENVYIEAGRAALDAGITTFDTAEVYGNGSSERLLARTFAGKRDDIIIATKVGAHHLTRQTVFDACEGSLKNLETDRIDLYQIHWPSGSWGGDIVPLSETMDALLTLQAQGKIRHIGVSNFSPEQVKKALSFGRIESIQPPYSLFWRQSAESLLPVCCENQLTILAYSPLAQGLLTGKYGRGNTFPDNDPRLGNRLFKGADFERAQTALDELRPIASRLGISLTTLCLAWVNRDPLVTAIVGAKTPAQALENAGSADVTLTESVAAELDNISRIVTDHLDDNPKMFA